MPTDTDTYTQNPGPPPAQIPDPRFTTQTGYGSFMVRMGRGEWSPPRLLPEAGDPQRALLAHLLETRIPEAPS